LDETERITRQVRSAHIDHRDTLGFANFISLSLRSFLMSDDLRLSMQSQLEELRVRQRELQTELVVISAQIELLERLMAPPTLAVSAVGRGLAPVPAEVARATCPDQQEVRARMVRVLQGHSSPASSVDRLDLLDAVMHAVDGGGGLGHVPQTCEEDVAQKIEIVLDSGPPFRIVQSGPKTGNVYFREA
jgi:hypothetical protein